ncbi:MAG: hypothetical protein R3272_09140 [Candidatus Promineifilaceae bacterium]|nr:hypothetical protein [Candidatus Promineifilaceae bacterium]
MNADFIRKNELQALINHRADPAISIYLPMARKGPDVSGNVIRMKTGLKQVAERLEAHDWRPSDIDDLLEEPRRLLHESPYWQHQSDGLAIFIAPDFFETYRLPLDFEPLTLIGDRFHIKPLLPLFSDDGRFYILALSQGDVRLFQATQYTVDEIELENVPKSIDDALWYDEPVEALMSHTVTSGAGGAPIGAVGSEPGITHHGQGEIDDQMLQRLRRYFNDVSDGVQKYLGDEDAPLVLAAVEYLHPIYKEADSSPHLLDEGVTGNPEEQRPEELHKAAWAIVEPLFAEAKADVFKRYKEMAHTDQASDDLMEIVPSAVQGRVDALFVAVGTQKWGEYDLETHSVDVHDERQNGDEDLLDFAAVQTLAYGGSVYAVTSDQMPSATPIAAVYRF